MEYSDWELVREIKNGNEEAMEILVRRWYPRVFAYVCRIIGREDDAYDVTQDVFLSVIKNIGSYLPFKRFDAWLFTVARNKCLDYFRTNRNLVTTDVGEAEICDVSTPFEGRVIDSVVIDGIFARLTPHQRETVKLHYIEGHTAKEIARMTNTPLPTVKSRISASRKILKKLLEDVRYE
ncbi:MAG: RNA polymerase sigma factor [Clostridia bacterium]|nr:RNA polymerase sigma factor [Clostridia bacterium]